jgi:hypothetical protein
VNGKGLDRNINDKYFTHNLRTFHSHSSFTSLSQSPSHLKTVETQSLQDFKTRYAAIKEAHNSPNACQAILLPRQRTRYTTNFALTGGNDRSIRYWNLGGETANYMVNSPELEDRP